MSQMSPPINIIWGVSEIPGPHLQSCWCSKFKAWLRNLNFSCVPPLSCTHVQQFWHGVSENTPGEPVVTSPCRCQTTTIGQDLCSLWEPGEQQHTSWGSQRACHSEHPSPIIRNQFWASLVTLWWRIRLPTQEMQVGSLFWEDLKSRGETKPVSHNSCTSAPQ